MENFFMSQIAKIALIVAFLLVAPLLSSSMRPPFLYVLFNLLIILLGAESGVLRALFKAPDEKKPALVAVTPTATETPSDKKSSTSTTESPDDNERPVKKEEKPTVVKNAAVGWVQKVKKSSSTPSLFFIGSGEVEEFVEDEGDDDASDGSEEEGKELFVKAETFIGNFYKELKIQREESWKKIHGLYQRAF